MFFTTKTYYALIAILEIAHRTSASDISLIALDDICQEHGIDKSYLEQLMGRLRRAKIIEAVKGPGGGYILNHKPQNISLYDIAKAAGDDIHVTKCKNEEHGCLMKDRKCLAHKLLTEIEDVIMHKLKKINLEMMLDTTFNDLKLMISN